MVFTNQEIDDFAIPSELHTDVHHLAFQHCWFFRQKCSLCSKSSRFLSANRRIVVKSVAGIQLCICFCRPCPKNEINWTQIGSLIVYFRCCISITNRWDEFRFNMRQCLIETLQELDICVFRKTQVEEAHCSFRNNAMKTTRTDNQNRRKL